MGIGNIAEKIAARRVAFKGFTAEAQAKAVKNAEAKTARKAAQNTASLDRDWENLVSAQQKPKGVTGFKNAEFETRRKAAVAAREQRLAGPTGDTEAYNELHKMSTSMGASRAGMSTREYSNFQKRQSGKIQSDFDAIKGIDPNANLGDVRSMAIDDFKAAKEAKLDARQAKKESRRETRRENRQNKNITDDMNFGDIDSPSVASVSGGAASSGPANNVENVISGRATNILDHNKQRFTPKMEADIEKYSAMVKSGDTEGLKKMGAGMGIEGDLTEKGIKEHWGSRMATPTMGDKMSYHQVPQKLAAVGGTAWLVSNMSGSKGQMDNSQLYGQSKPYGM
jgi:hypothetical protein